MLPLKWDTTKNKKSFAEKCKTSQDRHNLQKKTIK